MNNESQSSATVEAVENSFEIIRTLQELNGAGVTELATHLDMSKSGIHKHLTTLRELGFVIQRNHEYRLSFEFLSVSQMLRTDNIMYNVGAPEVDNLAEKSGVSAYLIVLEETRAYCIYTAEGENSIEMDLEVGDKIPFHSTSAGKAILSSLPEKQRDRLLDENLPEKTDNTICDLTALEEEIDSIQQKEVAFEDEENVYGMRGVAAPIEQPDNGTVGAVGLLGPVSIVDDDAFFNEFPDLISQAKNFIEVKTSLTPPTRLR